MGVSFEIFRLDAWDEQLEHTEGSGLTPALQSFTSWFTYLVTK